MTARPHVPGTPRRRALVGGCCVALLLASAQVVAQDASELAAQDEPPAPETRTVFPTIVLPIRTSFGATASRPSNSSI